MKLFVPFLVLLLVISSLMGCRPNQVEDTQPSSLIASQVPSSTKEQPAQAKVVPTISEKPVAESPKEDPASSSVVVERQPQATTQKESPPAPAPERATETLTEIPSEVRDILTRADSKVKSYSYTYAPPPDQLARDKWNIRGSKIRIDLFEDNFVEPDTYYDTIFIDTETKTVIGVCASQRITRCKVKNQRFELDYGVYMRKTPYQLLKEVEGSPKIVSTQLLYDRKASVVEYEKGGIIYSLWIDQYSGLPIRMQVGQDNRSKTEFRYMSINSVNENDLVPPSSPQIK